MILSYTIDFVIFFTTIAKLVSVIVGAGNVYDDEGASEQA